MKLDHRSNLIKNTRPLSWLGDLTSLSLSFNEISDLESLSELLNLKTLSLDNNQIVGISPLLSNTGLRHFDIVSLLSNPLHEEALSEQVTALRSIGV